MGLSAVTGAGLALPVHGQGPGMLTGLQLEIAVTGADDAGIAAEEGADRIELCSALELGGITPTQGLMEAACETVAGRLGVHPLIRCRPGSFSYTPSEVDTMARDIRHLVRQGARGVVVGALAADGGIDLAAARKWMEAAREVDGAVQLTFHRAIDSGRDVLEAVDALVELGFDGVLSSGGAPTVAEGASVLRRMVARTAGSLEVMAGGGLTVSDIAAARSWGVAAVHLSAKRMVQARCLEGRPRVSGSGEPALHMVVDRSVVASARAASLA